MEKETCSFCGCTKDEVNFLVNGPSELYICNECIEACMELWKDFQKEEEAMAAYVANQRLIDKAKE